MKCVIMTKTTLIVLEPFRAVNNYSPYGVYLHSVLIHTGLT